MEFFFGPSQTWLRLAPTGTLLRVLTDLARAVGKNTEPLEELLGKQVMGHSFTLQKVMMQ